MNNGDVVSSTYEQKTIVSTFDNDLLEIILLLKFTLKFKT